MELRRLPSAHNKAAATRWTHGGARGCRGIVARVALLLVLSVATFADTDSVTNNDAESSTPGPTLLRKCCGAHEQLSAGLDECVPYADAAREASAAGDAQTAWESVGAVHRRAGDGFPWWANASTPLYDARTGENASRPLLRAQPPAAALRYGPSPPCARSLFKYFTWNSLKRYRLLTNGTLLLRTDDQPSEDVPGLALPPDLYCVDLVADTHVFLACPCNRTACVNKCCGQKEELYISVFRKLLKPTCQDRETYPMWKPEFYSSESANETTTASYILLDALPPTCNFNSDLVVLNGEVSGAANAIRVLPNGSAIMQGYGHGTAFPPDTWCADTSSVNGRRRVDNALVCVVKRANLNSPVSSLLYGSLFLLSSFCLAATLLVYALLPELRRSAHAKALLCHVAALLAGSLTLASGQLRGAVESMRECYLLAFVIQYFMLAAFFWLNAVCFDLAWNFREILPPKACNVRERCKFLCYSVYAWGCPAVISAVTAFMDFAEGIPDYLVKPNIGLQDCWFYKLPALFAYFYGPVALLLAVNLVLYAHTALQLVYARRETALVDAAGGGGETARSALGNPRERALLHLKLFLLMGVTWVMECVSVVVGQDDAYWYLPDAVNILRGVFVFVLLCCKKVVGRRLRSRVRQLGCWAAGGKTVQRRGCKKGVDAGGEDEGDRVGPAADAAEEGEEKQEDRKRRSGTSSGGSSEPGDSGGTDATHTTALSVGAAQCPSDPSKDDSNNKQIKCV